VRNGTDSTAALREALSAACLQHGSCFCSVAVSADLIERTMPDAISITRNPAHNPTVTALGFLPALLAILFGALLIYGVGFAGPASLHNAAHDTRHAYAFPCH
jgi:cobalt transporter subunit CbtB